MAQYDADAKLITDLIYAKLLNAFPIPVSFFDKDMAESLGLEWKEVRHGMGIPQLEIATMPNGGDMEALLEAILTWLYSEGYTRVNTRVYREVVLTEKGLSALKARPDYLP